jgi:hypothetical protein
MYRDKHFNRAPYLRRGAEFFGILPLFAQLISSNFKPNYVSIGLLMVPWCTGVIMNLGYYFYLDYKFEKMYLYEKYGITD